MTQAFLKWCAIAACGVTSGLVALVATACKCQDDAPHNTVHVELTSEQRQAADVDRVRFNLRTPQDYAKEAYLAIDVDNVKTEFETLRREIEAEFAANATAASGVAPTATP